MKIVVLLLAIATLAVAFPPKNKNSKGSKNDDGYDVEEIIANRRLLLPYIKCALDQGKCTSAGKDLKDNIKDALVTDCGKCTESEKKDSKLVFKHLINKEKDYWTQLVAKYDPERQYAPRYEKEYLGKA